MEHFLYLYMNLLSLLALFMTTFETIMSNKYDKKEDKSVKGKTADKPKLKGDKKEGKNEKKMTDKPKFKGNKIGVQNEKETSIKTKPKSDGKMGKSGKEMVDKAKPSDHKKDDRGRNVSCDNSLAATAKLKGKEKEETNGSMSSEICLVMKPKGLPNIGMTCFMNSILQCLVWTPGMKHQLELQVKKSVYPDKSESIACRLLALINDINAETGNGTVTSKRTVKRLLNAVRKRNSQFSGYNQQDSYEMFNAIISGIEDEILNHDEDDKKECPKDITDTERIMNICPVTRLFGGMFVTVYSFSSCSHIEIDFQRFTSICVPVPCEVIPGRTKLERNWSIDHFSSYDGQYLLNDLNNDKSNLGADESVPCLFDCADEKKQKKRKETPSSCTKTNMVHLCPENEKNSIIETTSKENGGGFPTANDHLSSNRGKEDGNEMIHLNERNDTTLGEKEGNNRPRDRIIALLSKNVERTDKEAQNSCPITVQGKLNNRKRKSYDNKELHQPPTKKLKKSDVPDGTDIKMQQIKECNKNSKNNTEHSPTDNIIESQTYVFSEPTEKTSEDGEISFKANINHHDALSIEKMSISKTEEQNSLKKDDCDIMERHTDVRSSTDMSRKRGSLQHMNEETNTIHQYSIEKEESKLQIDCDEKKDKNCAKSIEINTNNKNCQTIRKQTRKRQRNKNPKKKHRKSKRTKPSQVMDQETRKMENNSDDNEMTSDTNKNIASDHEETSIHPEPMEIDSQEVSAQGTEVQNNDDDIDIIYTDQEIECEGKTSETKESLLCGHNTDTNLLMLCQEKNSISKTEKQNSLGQKNNDLRNCDIGKDKNCPRNRDITSHDIIHETKTNVEKASSTLGFHNNEAHIILEQNRQKITKPPNNKDKNKIMDSQETTTLEHSSDGNDMNLKTNTNCEPEIEEESIQNNPMEIDGQEVSAEDTEVQCKKDGKVVTYKEQENEDKGEGKESNSRNDVNTSRSTTDSNVPRDDTQNEDKHFETLTDAASGINKIEKGLQELTAKETFSENNLPCSSCNTTEANGRCYKKLMIMLPPPVLVLQINRFKQFGGGLEKIQSEVSYPEHLDIEPFVSSAYKLLQSKSINTKYSLYGVVCHSGSIVGGHYYAYIKTSRDNTEYFQRHFVEGKWSDPERLKDEILEFWSTRNMPNKVSNSVSGSCTMQESDFKSVESKNETKEDIKQTENLIVGNASNDTTDSDTKMETGKYGGSKKQADKNRNKKEDEYDSMTTSLPITNTQPEWYYISDSLVVHERKAKNALHDKNAYILMYEMVPKQDDCHVC